MPRPNSYAHLRLSVDVLRLAAQAAVHTESLRSVAAAIGMSPPGLQHFLHGGFPLRATLRKLAAWYTCRAHQRHHVPEEALHAALALLLDDLPAAQREEAASEMMSVLRRRYKELRVQAPSWTYTLAGETPDLAEREPSLAEVTGPPQRRA